MRKPSDADTGKRIMSPLVVASKSPVCSPSLGPVDEGMQAVPIDEVTFELLESAADVGEVVRPNGEGGGELIAQANANLGRDEPAYVVPTTPSPFLHSAFPPSVVPPFSYGSGMYDMPGLPPAFSDEAPTMGVGGVDGYSVDGQYMQGMGFLPEMFENAYGCGWPPGAWGFQGGDSGGVGVGGVFLPGGDAQDGGGLMERAGAVASGSHPYASHKDGGCLAPAVGLDYDTGKGASKDGGKRGGGKGKNKKDDRDEEQQQQQHRADRRGARDSEKGGAPARGGGGGGGDWEGERNGAADRSAAGGRSEDRGAEAAGGYGADQDIPANYTTVMLRNIPNKYTREMLIKQLSIEFGGTFDFMYLPIDFKNKCNVGYGFINFRTPEACETFVSKFHGVDVRKCLPGLNSKKIVEVTPARVQGLTENVRRLRNSPVMNQLQDHPEWMPLLFNADGTEEPFPRPDVPLPPVKPRGRNREARPYDG